VIKGINDYQVGEILKFAFENIDIIRGVNFQPVSLVGSMPDEVEKFRITIPEVIKKIEEQLNNEIKKDDFYPVPSVASISNLIKILTGNPQLTLTTHFACGMATYVFKDEEKLVPVTRFIDVEGFLKLIKKEIEELKFNRSRKISILKGLLNFRKVIKKKNVPKGLKIEKILLDIFLRHNYQALGEFHNKSLFIGLMHFMDLYNYDIERVKRCQIHYCSPDGRLIPFCTFNVLSEIYRDKIQKEYSMPIEEWEKRTGKKLEDDWKK
jgi:uncharacterized radical SAM superfamily Fe-S cluster-containing enzyme